MLPAFTRPLVSLRVSGARTKAIATMAEALAKIPDVEIDPEGTFKYILVRVKVADGELNKDIVRGTKSAQYHSKFTAGTLSVSVQLQITCKPWRRIVALLLWTEPISLLCRCTVKTCVNAAQQGTCLSNVCKAYQSVMFIVNICNDLDVKLIIRKLAYSTDLQLNLRLCSFEW